VFQNIQEDFQLVSEKIISLYNFLPPKIIQHKNKKIREHKISQMSFPRDFFDGAPQNSICACSIFISMNEDHNFSIHWNGGKGTNNKAEAMALSGLLHFNTFLNIPSLQIYGDSKLIIDHVIGKLSIKNHLLT